MIKKANYYALEAAGVVVTDCDARGRSSWRLQLCISSITVVVYDRFHFVPLVTVDLSSDLEVVPVQALRSVQVVLVESLFGPSST